MKNEQTNLNIHYFNKPINPNLHYLFEKKEDEAVEINKQIQELMRTYIDIDEFKKIIKEKYGNGKEFWEYTYLSDLISCLTTNEYEYGTNILLMDMKTLLVVKGISDLGNGKYQVETLDGTINFRTMSSFLEKNIPENKFKEQSDLSKYYETIQNREARNNGCHALAIDGVIILSNNLRLNTTLVTGYNSYYVPDNKYLHSWIELESNGRTYVIDSTANIVMNKEGYYILRQVQENEIVSRISSEQIIEDQDRYGEFLDELDLKTYLTARDELIRDLEKNKHLFNNEDGEER